MDVGVHLFIATKGYSEFLQLSLEFLELRAIMISIDDVNSFCYFSLDYVSSFDLSDDLPKPSG